MSVEISKQPKDRYILRFPTHDQREALKQRAARNHRTMNAEILYLIEAGLRAINSQVSA
ncbi:Arc family DNA-binding protein [Massilia scottii]|uniref:Arc family DNA-binding protein n=1 Tax=Massilia scottii TaxID=3057166 RepID=UPI0027965718|nr:Arc family DNA-binding protein [Massilia sp. CCM 9029]MDQ1831950.1 Arc family DNA-binding protein [Massilia sp. CCM 9029]